MVQGEDKRGRCTNNLAGHRPVQTIGALTSIIPTIFTSNALPAATLTIYPGLELASSVLVAVPLDWLLSPNNP